MAMDNPLPDPLPHILLVSLPAPGHLFPFTSFAYQLAAAGAQVTLLTTGYVFEHLQHRGDHKYKPTSSGSSSSNGRVRFEGLMESTKEVHEVTLEHMLNWFFPLSDDEMGAALERRFLELRPRPCCIVADMFTGWAHDVANKLHVPRHTLFTMPAKDLALIIMLPELYERGELPYGAVKRDILLPGMAPVPPEDVWRSIADGGHPHHPLLRKTFQNLGESSSIILNTFEELEAQTLKALRTDYAAANIKVPEIWPILLSNIPRMQSRGSNGTSREDDHVSEVEKWLDTQAPASVIYISFGSVATLTEQQTETLARALEASKYPFVWVYRPPGVPQVSRQTTVSKSTTHENSHEYFPPGFQDRVSGRAMLIKGWAPQPQILTHHAVGAFLTHCGWNSTLESVCAGVPMLCWPFWADQKINARFITDTAQVGLRIHRNADGTVNQDEIEKVLKQMMEGEEGKAARSKALEFQLLAQKNVADGGASSTNLDRILQQCTPASPSHGSCRC